MSTKVWTFLRSVREAIFNPRIKATVCGHLTKQTDTLVAFGKTKEVCLLIKNDKTPYCHACLSRMAIRCAICGDPIHIGDMVLVGESVDSENMFVQYIASHKGSKVYVACTRASCLDIVGTAERGVWVAPGKICFAHEQTP